MAQPVPDKETREDEVIDSYLAYLATTGVIATLREQPDRIPDADRTFSNVTSDALVELHRNGTTEWWAMDVMALAAPHTHAQIPDEINKALGPIVQARHLDLTVTGEIGDIEQTNKLIATVLTIADPNSTGSVEQGAAIAKWRPIGTGEAEINIAIMLPSPSPKLSDQIAATIRRPLSKKITNQAARAIAAGCKAAVLLDGVGHPGIEQGTHWLAQHATTYRQAVESVLSAVDGGHLDLVAFLDHDGAWHTLHGGI